MAARGQGDLGGGEVGDGGRVADGADCLFARAEFGLTAAKIGVGQGQLGADRLGRDAKAVKLDRVKFDANLAVGTAVAVDATDAGAALQFASDNIVDEIGYFFEGQRGGRHGEGHDGLTFDVEFGDSGCIDIGGQVALDRVNRVLDVLQRLGGGHVHAELDHRDGNPAGHVGGDILDAVDANEGIFDLFGDLRLHLGRGGAGLRDGDEHDRHVDVGEAGDRQGDEALPAHDHEDDEGQKRADGVADGPG